MDVAWQDSGPSFLDSSGSDASSFASFASGDGSGVLTQIPRRLIASELERLHQVRLEESDAIGVGMFFLPPSPDSEMT